MIKDTFQGWIDDKAPRIAAALAYYTIVSMAPLLIIVVAISSLIFGQEAVRNQVLLQVQGMVGSQGADAFRTIMENVSVSRCGLVASIPGLITLIFGATGAFVELKDALNTIWNIEPRPGMGIIATIKDRIVSITLVMGTAFLLLVSLVISAALAAFGTFLRGIAPYIALVQTVNFIISFIVITLIFAAIYRFVPDAKVAWSDVWIGAAATSLLFTIGKYLIGLYLGKTTLVSAYGAAGSLVVILIWVYYSAQIFLLGAEFTRVYATQVGSRITPKADAVATQNPRASPSVSSTKRISQGSGTETSKQNQKHLRHWILYDIRIIIQRIYAFIRRL